MLTNTTGVENTAVGADALKMNTTGANNVAMGYQALDANTTANYNAAYGVNSLTSNTTGERNCAFGSASAENNVTGSYVTAVGQGALYSSTASNLTAFGFNAGYNNTTGSGNVFIGARSGTSTGAGGAITGANGVFVLGDDNISTLYCNTTSITSSDERDKTDVERFNHGLSWINKLKPVTYRWDKRSWYLDQEDPNATIDQGRPDGSKKDSQLHIGFLAQEHLEVEKEHGYGDTKENMLITDLSPDGMRYGLMYERLVPVLVNAVKELSAEVEQLKSQLNN